MTANAGLNETDILKYLIGLCTLFAFVWSASKLFATQKDFDKLVKRVELLETAQTQALIATAELRTAVRSLESAVRDLTSFLRNGRGPACGVAYIPNMGDDNNDK